MVRLGQAWLRRYPSLVTAALWRLQKKRPGVIPGVSGLYAGMVYEP